MRKTIVVLLTVCALACCLYPVQSRADLLPEVTARPMPTASPSNADSASTPTERFGLIEFTELYTQRLVVYAGKAGIDVRIMPLRDMVYSFIPGTVMFTADVGSIIVDTNGYLVESVSMELSANGAAAQEAALRCIAGISALEYSYFDSVLMDTQQKSPLDEAALLFNEIIGKMQPAALQSARTGERVLVCSRNYDYLIGVNGDEAARHIMLTAQARK